MKNVMYGRLQRGYNVIKCTDFVISHSEVMHFSRISYFGQESGCVLRLGLGLGPRHLPHMHEERMDIIYLTINLPPPPR